MHNPPLWFYVIDNLARNKKIEIDFYELIVGIKEYIAISSLRIIIVSDQYTIINHVKQVKYSR